MGSIGPRPLGPTDSASQSLASREDCRAQGESKAFTFIVGVNMRSAFEVAKNLYRRYLGVRCFCRVLGGKLPKPISSRFMISALAYGKGGHMHHD